MHLYFAYGSNLLPARLRARTPSAQVAGTAMLEGFRLAWHKHGCDDSGKCDIVATESGHDRVHGALYEIDPEDWPALDIAEELGTGYEACRVRVRAGGEVRSAHSYRALKVTPELRPFTWYRDLVVAGARAHGLSDDYVQRLAETEAWIDPDRDRHRLHLRLLKPARQQR